MAEQIRAALSQDLPGVSATPVLSPETLTNLRIIPNSGVVVLRGSVTTGREKTAILSRVREMPGVKEVDDQLTVKESDAEGQPEETK